MSKSPPLILAAIFAVVLPVFAADDPKPISPQNTGVSYYKQIWPIVQAKCVGCHQPVKKEAELLMTSYEAIAKGGKTGVPWEPGEPDLSLIVQQISGAQPKMPKDAAPLSPMEVNLFRQWVAQGAKDDSPAIPKDPINAKNPPTYRTPPVITALAYSNDGSKLAVSGYHEVLIHNADGSGLLARLIGESHRIESVVYSPVGDVIGVVGGFPARFGEIQFWDASKLTPINAVKVTFDTIYGASFSPDGKFLAFGGADNSARIVSVPGCEQIMNFTNHNDWIFATTWARDPKAPPANLPKNTDRANFVIPPDPKSTYLVTASRDKAIKLIQVEGVHGNFIDDVNNQVYDGWKCMTKHPKEQWVAVGGMDKIPRLFQVFQTQARTMMREDYNLKRAFEAQAGPIMCIAFSPDGTKLAVGGGGEARKENEVRIYNTADGKLSASLKGHIGGIYALAYRPDGQQIATGGFDGKVRLFNANDGVLVKEFVPVPIKQEVANKE